MIINLQTMTEAEMLFTCNAVWQVYEESCWRVDGNHDAAGEWGDLCREAWQELNELAQEWRRRGHEGRAFLLLPDANNESDNYVTR